MELVFSGGTYMVVEEVVVQLLLEVTPSIKNGGAGATTSI
jgi:hypothetical protein